MSLLAQRGNLANVIMIMKLEFHPEIIAQFCQGLIGFFFNSKGQAQVFLISVKQYFSNCTPGNSIVLQAINKNYVKRGY